MYIHELAQRTGLTPATIRFYEKEGLLDPRFIQRGANNYRRYTEEVVERLLLIKFGQTAGFTLSEIKALMQDVDAGKLTTDEQINLLERKRSEIDQRIAEMQQIRNLLTAKLAIIRQGEDAPASGIPL